MSEADMFTHSLSPGSAVAGRAHMETRMLHKSPRRPPPNDDWGDGIGWREGGGIPPRLGLQPTRGVLLYGPPGTGKTSLASACAFEAGVNMFPINGPEIVSEYYGESEQALHAVFKSAEHAAPSVVFIDELDAIAPARKDGSEELSQRMVAALLALIDGVNNHHRVLVIAATNRPESIDPALRRPGRLDREIEIGLNPRIDVTVIAATNRPDKIDAALLRPGRFDRLLYVGPPNEDDRKEIFNIHMKKMPCGSDLTNLELASLTNGYTGADISAVCREAAIAALEENLNIQEVSMRHFKVALARVPPSDFTDYESLSVRFQRHISSNALHGTVD